MILNKAIIANAPNVGLGDAFSVWLTKANGQDQRKMWEGYLKELLDRDYDQLGSLLERVFRLMKQNDVGVDYELFYQAMEVWDEGDKEIRHNIARTIWGGRGGFRLGAGAKTIDPLGPKQPLGISRVAPDVANIVAKVYGSKTEFVENAIRHYQKYITDQEGPSAGAVSGEFDRLR